VSVICLWRFVLRVQRLSCNFYNFPGGLQFQSFRYIQLFSISVSVAVQFSLFIVLATLHALALFNGTGESATGRLCVMHVSVHLTANSDNMHNNITSLSPSVNITARRNCLRHLYHIVFRNSNFRYK